MLQVLLHISQMTKQIGNYAEECIFLNEKVEYSDNLVNKQLYM